VHHEPGPACLRQEDAIAFELYLLWVGIAEAVVLAFLTESRVSGPTFEHVLEAGMKVVDGLLQGMVRNVVEKVELLLEVRELLDLVKLGDAFLAAVVLTFLLQAQIVDQPAAADRLPEEVFLLCVGIDPELVGLALEHRYEHWSEAISWAHAAESQKQFLSGKPTKVGKARA
jgi:hypothetical protein